MDKLERALEKARQQRQIQLEKQASQQQKARAPLLKAPSMPTPGADLANTFTVQEGYLQAHHIIAHHTRDQDADTFRILRTKILQVMGQSGLKTLGITSPNYGDGKTTIALNLAVSIALDLKQTVLLVDLDLRKPNVTEYLGVQSQHGITDHLVHNVPLADCLMRPSFERMTILPAGHVVEASSEVLGSPQMADLAKELATRYDDRLIIYDLPPTLVQDDPIAFLPHIDALLLVVNDGVTRVDELKLSLNILAGANVIGTVLNHSAVRTRKGFLGKLGRLLDKASA